MLDLVYCLINLLYFDIPLLYSHTHLSSPIIFCLSGDICLSLGFYLSLYFVTVSELFCGEIFEIYVILSAILLPIESPVISADYWITLFEAVLRASVADCTT